MAGIPAPRVGRYVITKGDENRVNLGISLLSPFASQLTTVDKITFNEMTVDVASHQSRINKPLWPLFTTLGVLLLEWWFFNHPGRVSVTR